MESINQMTQKEKQDLVMQVVDCALKKGMGISVQNNTSLISIVDQQFETKFFHINGMAFLQKNALKKPLNMFLNTSLKKSLSIN